MDMTMVGGILSASLEVLFDRMASRDFINFFRGRREEERLLKKLEITLLSLKPLLDDAEIKQWTDPAVKDWVDELKDVIYHADDLLDEIATESMRSKLDSEFPTSSPAPTFLVSSWSPFGLDSEIQSVGRTTTKVRDILSWCAFGEDTESKLDPEFPSRRTTSQLIDLVSCSLFGEYTGSKIEKVVRRLEYFVNAKDSLRLREVVFGRNNSLPKTFGLVEDCVSVYGRDDDKETIMQLLISDDDDDDDSSGHRIGVIPIVGMGGIGKTTLAKLVYNHPKVEEHFEEKIWVCVSEEFDILKITKAILQGLTEGTCHTNDLNVLQGSLMNHLRGKKFLLVLDDIWNENYDDWDKLRSPFRLGKHGSKIILTTRNMGAASIMQTVPVFHLRSLSDEDCWLLFSKHAFENVGPSVPPELVKIGRQIVEKCQGLPLAARTLGGLLRSKVEVAEWENVLHSHLWDFPKEKCGILPALLLSYHHLPSHLKLCFAFCAIIPKDYAFEKDELVPLWIAEGFVQQQITNGRIEEIGDSYFHELISRSFFQQSSGNKFLMHDLISDLAQYIAGEYCFRLADDHRPNLSRVRYFSYFKGRFAAFAKLKAISEANCLRTFKPWSLYSRGSSYRLSNKVLHDVLPKLRCLRVLSLSECDTGELPGSIGDLIHLRYLNLSYTRIKCLPESISRLCNLQTLLLRNCKSLTRLPTYLCKLICLRHLDTSVTNLREMPMQIGRLRSLQVLTTFVVGNQIGSKISELREIHHLRGTLSISNLQNVRNVRDAFEANLPNKKHLEKLELTWVTGDTDDSQKAREVLDKLQPHINLKHLTIENYGGTRFPAWLGDHSFFNIKILCLRSCINCFELPPLGQLPSLQELSIVRMNMVMKVGSEFYGCNSSGIGPFQCLEKLRFEEMPEWEEWSILGAGELCHLLELRISKCSKLIGEFPRHLPYLKKLEISGCKLLVIENILKPDDDGKMVIHSATGAVSEQHLSSLQVLEIQNISELQILTLELCRLTNLEELSILNCPMLNSIQTMVSSQPLPNEEMKHVNSTLKTLSIISCRKLELSLSADTEHHFKLLQNLTISSSCDSLKSFPLGFFPKLRYLRIKKCRNMESLSSLGELQNLSSLQSIDITTSPNMVSFAGGLHTLNLISISIESCEKLKALPKEMCTLLTSLQSLRMKYLPEIESFPSEGLPCSLSYLYIGFCDKLMARRMDWGLQRLPSLTRCDVHGEGEFLESFPDECLFPTSLTHLDIAFRPNLKSLNPKGLRHLNSLENLLISHCPKLQSLPDEGLPNSLLSLTIRDCPLLKVRCQREKGEDWPYISHIRNIEIDGVLVE